ncbi:MAG: cytochrome c3 family protein [Coriobacteriia bacterium]
MTATAAITVAAMVLSVPAGSAFAAEPLTGGSPHAVTTRDSSYCGECHVPHEAGSDQYILRFESTGEFSQKAFCYTCHDGGLAANAKTGLTNASFWTTGTSGHFLEERGENATPAANLTDACTSCHYPHADSTTRMRLPQETINGKTVTGADNTWCFACHDDAQSWWVSVDALNRDTTDYTDLIPTPSLNATGYPLVGTFPGQTVYGTPAKNAHASIPAGSMDDWAMASREATRVAGDCLWCHSGHRGVSEYDGLVGKFGASTDQVKDTVNGEYAEVCFTCHKVDGLVPAPDIASAALGDAADSGHTIRTDDARYPKGSPLPCYECHNPHGSTRNNTANISDALGQNLDPRDPADPLNVGASKEKVRQFCFSCHVTYDVDPLTTRPWAWDSVAGAYVAVTDGATAIGLPRNVAVGVNDLRLPMANGHNVGDTDRACYECHGDVHKPMSGTSNGGVKCSVCHSALNGMVNDTNTYHHVLDDPNWDQAPGTYVGGVYGTTPYPTSQDSLSCVSCHVDHSAYEPLPADDSRADGKGYSLRDSATVANPTPSNTDDTLCLSCHSVERARNTTGQKANTIQETNVWLIDEEWWATSPHNYDSPGPFNDGSTFNANCAKCHGNLQGTLSSGKFSVHMSAEQRLLNALGDTVAINLAINEEQMCFRCHSKAADFTANGGSLPGIPKPSDFVDWYGTQQMTESNVAIYEMMDPAINNNGHKPADYPSAGVGGHLLSDVDETQAYLSANKHVECADCHNHHVVGQARHTWGTSNVVSAAIQGVTGQGFKSGTGVGLEALENISWPSDAVVNAQLEWKGSSAGYALREFSICFKCHSSANSLAGVSQLGAWGGTKTGAVTTNRWTNVAQDFNVGNQSRHPVIATLSGRYDVNADGVVADDGSETIPGYTDTTSYGTSKVYAGQLDATIWTPGDTMYCSDCHGNENSPLPTDPTAVNFTQGPHGSSVEYSLRGPNTWWPKDPNGNLWTLGTAGTAAANGTANGDDPFCANCHPSITANKVHARNTTHRNSACVNCHILVPHGGGMSRLLGDGDGAMPARYAYNNDKRTMMISSFTKRLDPATYTRGDCRVTTAATACSGGTAHTAGSDPAKENW